ncbi:HIG1 domain family member 1A, mitochondrial-like isoform X2 [Homalodisca vitripennis]|uniref:HIG1 domain family member 1A, mitochondrial-like isoform X2 n=1 Tax=Homalodisca vitripennis TaxID=197043 RepID=UPI001EEC1731|nr:HIG1 domain family member 1A, mitochondrial-like isoform X2 [Homalodisca vitripennis]XP_046667341.1 HIG1 domain family member 1A, mitochondrial-like isoform X2 [Homalodisca vitripennis]
MDESQGDRLSRKMKEAPLLPIGLLGFVGALGYGAYKYKHRGEMSRSLFFVQLRVGAQSMVVGALVISIALSLGKRLLNQTSREH